MASITAPAAGRRLIHPVRLRSAVTLPRPTSWLELFFDLIFVAAISQLAGPLAEDYSFTGALRFAFLFVLVWWSWFDHTLFSSRFHVDDSLQRAMTIVQIFVVAVMAANAKGSLSSREAAGFGAAFGVMRLILWLQYLRARLESRRTRVVNEQLLRIGVSGIMWLVAALVPINLRFLLWGIALTIDTVGPWWRREHLRHVAPDPHHLPERYGLFTVILLGEFVASIMRGMEAQESWPVFAFLVAIGGFCVAFLCWWLYFGRNEHSDSSPVNATDAAKLQRWLYLHVPLYLSLTSTGVAFEHIIAGRHFGREEAVLMLSSCAGLGGLLLFFWRMHPAGSLTAIEVKHDRP